MDEPLAPASFEKYFSLMNSQGKRDKHNILELLRASQSNDALLAIQFREAAKKFRLIDDNGVSIIVPFRPDNKANSPVDGWIKMLESDPSQKWIYRKLQRYTVSIPERLANEFQVSGGVEIRAGLIVLLECNYHNRLGVDLPDRLLTPDECVY